MAQNQNPKKDSGTQVDPEMIKNLDLLMNMDVVERESDWDSIENMDEEDLEIPSEGLEDEA